VGYEHILFDVDEPVATVTLNRPEALNAWTDTMTHEVRDAVGRAERDPTVVGIVLTGAGRGFCAGADMKMLSARAQGDTTAMESPLATVAKPGDESWGEDLRGTFTYLLSVPKPVIAAINGAVAGMAVPIVLACDLRFMSETAVLTTAFAQRGLVAEWGLSWLLPRLVGPAHALDLLFSARRVDGVEAARMGLVNRALPAAEVLVAAQDYVRGLARSSSPASMAIMKRQVYSELHAGLAAAERNAIGLMAESFDRPDFAEGVASYVERRPPNFPRLP
jgi:enoyl-CoA hydratase/carnithine racemase